MELWLLFIFAVTVSFLLAYGIGANDVANAMGTAVGAGALTVKQAILVASIFEVLGVFLAGGSVIHTIQEKLIHSDIVLYASDTLMMGMLACSLANGIWLLIASFFGWPVSSTHAMVGSLAGFVGFHLGIRAIQWSTLALIVLSWLVTPLIAMALAFLIFHGIQRFILNKSEPIRQAKHYVPYCIFIMAWLMIWLTCRFGLPYIGFVLNGWVCMISALLGAGLILIGVRYHLTALRLLTDVPFANAQSSHQSSQLEPIFAILMVITASIMAFAHGANDVANAVGPLAVIMNGLQGDLEPYVPLWILLIGALGIIVGLSTWGYKVIATVGRNITELTPSRGFAAELAAASTVMLASFFGIPVSTTHTLVGAILGVGLARGFMALNLSVIRDIGFAWLLTIPTSAGLSILLSKLLITIFN